jgi:trimethylamine--corrinoid protein Co-methyltransferase
MKSGRRGLTGGQLKFLTKYEVDEIDYAAKNILWRTGLRIPHKEALEILDKSGCVVDYKKEHVFIPSNLVEEAVRKAPHGFSYGGRDPKKAIRLERDKVFFVVGATGPNIYEADGTKRRGTVKSYQDVVRLTDACENVDVAGGDLTQFSIQKEWLNLPLSLRTAHQLLLRLELTEKPVDTTKTYVIDREGLVVEQAKQRAIDRINFDIAVRGSLEELRKMPMSWAANEPISPLIFDPTNVDGSLTYAKLGLPIMIGSEPMAGATSPATVAGTLSLWTAETLASLVLAQMAASPEHRPPIIWVTLAGLFDQKEATGPLFSSPEGVLIQAASAQIAHHYGFPIRGNAETNAKLPDAQAGYETSLALTISALAGINYNTSTGMIGPGQMGISLEKILLDNDLIGYVKRVVEGINVTEETLAIDVIDDVGIGGNYLKTEHTRKWVKKEQVYPRLFERAMYDVWVRRGKKDAVQRAKERVQEILKDHWPEPLDPDIRKRITDHIDKLKKNLKK